MVYRGAWVVVGSFFTHFFTFGAIYSSGVYVLPIAAAFDVGRGTAGACVSLWMGVMLAFSFQAGRLLDRHHPRSIFVAGGLCSAAGLFALSRALTLWQAIVASAFSGAFLSLCGPCSASVVQPWFNANRGAATGLAMMGTGAGHFTFTLVLEHLILRIGWRSALGLEAGVLATGVLGASLLFRKPLAGEVHSSHETVSEAQVQDPTLSKDAAVTARPVNFDEIDRQLHNGTVTGAHGKPSNRSPVPPQTVKLLTLMRTRAMLGICSFKFCAAFGYGIPFVHIVPMARDEGLSKGTAATVLAFMGLASSCGRVALGLLADRCGRLHVYKLSIVILGVAALLWPRAQTHGELFAFGIIYGFFAGAYPSLHGTIIADFFAADYESFMMRLIGLSFSSDTLGAILGPPIAGWIFDRDSSYIGAGVFAGAALLLGAACLCVVPQSAPEHRRNLAQILKRNQ